MDPSPSRGQNPFAVLRQFVRPRRNVERCELCSLELGPDHPHLLELAQRRLVCSCDACAVLFSGQPGGRYRRLPRQVQALTDFQLSDQQWDSLGIPIQLAFFFRNSQLDRIVAVYPSPAGPTEAQLPLNTWPELVGQHAVLGELEPDVEALLVNRVEGRREYFRVPIDECYRLVGLIRTNWRGLWGGTEAWQAVDHFFAELHQRAGTGRHQPHA
jgi:hypothetical protein